MVMWIHWHVLAYELTADEAVFLNNQKSWWVSRESGLCGTVWRICPTIESIKQKQTYALYSCDCIRNHQSTSAVQQGYQVQTSPILSVVAPEEKRGWKNLSMKVVTGEHNMLVWGAMWCKINGGGARKRGGRGRGKQGSEAKGRQQRKEKGIHASFRWEPQLEPFLKTFKSEPSTTTEKTVPHTHPHTLPPPLSLNTPRTAVSYLWTPLEGMYVCAYSNYMCHAHVYSVCVCVCVCVCVHAWVYVSMWVSVKLDYSVGVFFIFILSCRNSMFILNIKKMERKNKQIKTIKTTSGWKLDFF